MTGRQLARVNTVKYSETLWSELYPGNQHTVNCLQPAVTATESSLELAQAQRQRTVWRFDGGAGSDEQFQWLFNRGYHVVGKGLSNFRACALAQQVRRWDSYADCQLGEVTPPIDYGRPVRVFVKRRLKKDKWRHSYYVTSLQFPSKGLFMTAYNQRGGAEVEQFRQDKQGLALAARRKASLNGQKACVLLTDLAHNLLTHFSRHALAESRFRAFGLKRIVRDLLHIPGALHFEGVRVKKVELLTLNQNSRDLIICLEKYISGG